MDGIAAVAGIIDYRALTRLLELREYIFRRRDPRRYRRVMIGPVSLGGSGAKFPPCPRPRGRAFVWASADQNTY